MKIIFAGGGTAGHINPAVAIAKLIKNIDPNSKVLFIGTKRGLEKELVPNAGFDIQFIDTLGFKRKFSGYNIKALIKMFLSYSQSVKIIKAFKPDIVVGTGGYVSGPALAAAVRHKIPTLIHEQNVFPGLTSRLLGGIVDVVCVSFLQSKAVFKNAKKIVYTGNPLRHELFQITKTEARKKMGIDERPFIVAFGGSLGAEKLNDAILDFIISSKDKTAFQLLLSSGEAQFKEITKRLGENEAEGNPNIKIMSYIHNMEYPLCAADLIISRAGAITISEITALGKPSILIPSPNVTDNHQEHNARTLADAGAAIVITERELTGKSFSKCVNDLIFKKDKLIQMGEKSKGLGITTATEKISEIIFNLTKQKTKGVLK
ncbi:MAG: undecaprenyldiphospho-muramoylpentapeptide beta-N-acetylglucosaminyltransferase [Firmicutes bacterium]|nr:undecaprenyldiphospho-muramoylpentapeptide beta-N-acetylglucosaminyltransferase [Bacillota bacterium]